jgi:hypothetical protein
MKPDWKDAPSDATWLAMDVNENWWWYTSEPYFSEAEGCWLRDSGLAYPAHIKNNQLEAEESLERRPSTTTTTIERGGVSYVLGNSRIRRWIPRF